MSVLTICNHKGGTGKTTSSIHLAAALGRQGRRVLVVDLDPQGFLTRMLGAPEPPPEHSGLGLLDAHADLHTFPVHPASGFDLIGSSMAMTKSLRQLTRPTDVLWLRETIRAGHGYDLVLLDTAAALSVFTMNALVASDHVVIPVTPEYQPVVGAEQTWQTCGLVKDKLNPRLATPRFLLTQVDARLNRHARYTEYLRQKYGDAVLETAIRTSSSLAVASRDGRTVFDARLSTRGAVDYAEAGREVAGYVFDAPAGPASAPEPSADPAADVAPTAPTHTPTPDVLAPGAAATEPVPPPDDAPTLVGGEDDGAAPDEALAYDNAEPTPAEPPSLASQLSPFRRAPIPGDGHGVAVHPPAAPPPASGPGAEPRDPFADDDPTPPGSSNWTPLDRL